MPKKICFSKWLLVVDYLILGWLLWQLRADMHAEIDVTNLAIVIAAWIAQIAISSGFYYWKAKAENLIKILLQLMADLPKDMREKTDPNQMVDSVFNLKN